VEVLWQEILDDQTLYLVPGLIVTLALSRVFAPDEHKRARAAVFLTVLHLLLLPVCAWLRHRELSAYADVRLALFAVTILAFTGLAGVLLFAVLLPRIGLRTPRILRDLVTGIAAIVAMIAAASRLGFNLSGLIATSAVLTAVIGFSMQDTLGNIMGGLALQLDNSVKLGDWIKVGNDVNGRVVEIRWRYTAVENRNWETVIIPNSVLMKGQVVVVGRRTDQPQYWRRWVWFNVDFRYQPSDVIECVETALRGVAIERVAKDPPPNCVLMDFHESYCRFAVRYMLTDIAVDDPTDSVVRTRIYFALKRAGIPLSIPAHSIFMTEEDAERAEKKTREDLEQRLRVLRQVSIFTMLEQQDLDELAPALRYAPFTKNEVMTRQGAEAHWLYMMIDGEAKVLVARDGIEKEVARLHAGDFFGEMSLMTGAKRAATVVAVTDVECYRLDKAEFQRIVQQRPELAEKFAEVLAGRRVGLLAATEGLTAESRIARMKAEERDLVHRIRSFFGLAA
jgi:small-conductance mechanosensitive channel